MQASGDMSSRVPHGDVRPVALTVAGSDSGGGAGIQMDLRVFAARGVFGTSALTCVTAQNPTSVSRVEPLAPEMVAEQIRSVCSAFPVVAAKTGMLYSAEIIRAVAASAELRNVPHLVIDPVMVSAGGDPLLRPDAVEALCKEWLPRASVLTPNLPEAEILLGRPIRSAEDLMQAARDLARRFRTACFAKGGHLPGVSVPDAWVSADGEEVLLEGPRFPHADTHGAGCGVSAALAAELALGFSPLESARKARALIADAMRRPLRVGRFHPMDIEGAARAFGSRTA